MELQAGNGIEKLTVRLARQNGECVYSVFKAMNPNTTKHGVHSDQNQQRLKNNMKTKIVKTSILNPKNLVLCAILGTVLQGYAQPTTPPATPSAPQGHVISVYNSYGVYTNVPVQTYFENWYDPGADALYPLPSGTNVLSYVGMGCCAGIELGVNTINISGCTNLHVDVFTPNGNNFSIKLVDSGGAAAEITYTPASGVITQNGWIGLDMPISLFASITPTLKLYSIKQIGIIDGDGGGITPADYYVDNVYFSGATNLVFAPPPAIPAPTNNAPTPTQPAGQVLAIYDSSSTYSDWTAYEFPASWSGSPQSSFTITNTGSVVQYLSALSFVGDTYYPNPINTTGFDTFHIDLWTAVGNQFYIQLVSVVPNTQPAQVGVFNMATNRWVGFDIPLSQFVAANPATDFTDIQQILWVDNVGTGLQSADFYFDNAYFYNSRHLTCSVTGGTRNLSFLTQAGFDWTVQFKNNLTDSTWQTLTTVTGDGTIHTVSDSSSQARRFYRLSIQ